MLVKSGRITFSIDFTTTNGLERDFTVGADGRLLDVQIGLDEAPAPVRAVEAPTAPGAPAPDASGLAIPDYDGLAASQIIERLEGLDAAELDEVDRYERATRARRTVLGKIAVLRAS